MIYATCESWPSMLGTMSGGWVEVQHDKSKIQLIYTTVYFASPSLNMKGKNDTLKLLNTLIFRNWLININNWNINYLFNFYK